MALLTEVQRAIATATDEETVWTGRPLPGLYARPGDIARSASGVPFLAFILFWEYQVNRAAAPRFMMLWGGLFICTVLYIIVGQFFWNAYLRSRTYYALTKGGSAVIVRQAPFASVQYVNLPSTPTINVYTRSGGNGSLYFGAVPSLWSRAQTWPPGFENIPNVSDAYKLCCELQGRS